MKLKLLALLLCVLCVPVGAQVNTTTLIRRSFAKETLTVSTAAITLTAAVYTPAGGSDTATLATFTIEGCSIRAWATGDAPTSTVGQKLNVGDIITIFGTSDIKAVKLIRDTSCSADATLQVVYSR